MWQKLDDSRLTCKKQQEQESDLLREIDKLLGQVSSSRPMATITKYYLVRTSPLPWWRSSSGHLGWHRLTGAFDLEALRSHRDESRRELVSNELLEWTFQCTCLDLPAGNRCNWSDFLFVSSRQSARRSVWLFHPWEPSPRTSQQF